MTTTNQRRCGTYLLDYAQSRIRISGALEVCRISNNMNNKSEVILNTKNAENVWVTGGERACCLWRRTALSALYEPWTLALWILNYYTRCSKYTYTMGTCVICPRGLVPLISILSFSVELIGRLYNCVSTYMHYHHRYHHANTNTSQNGSTIHFLIVLIGRLLYGTPGGRVKRRSINFVLNLNVQF